MAGNSNSGRLGNVAKMELETGEFTERIPRDFPKNAKAYWRKIIPILKERRSIQNKDIFAFKRLCLLYHLWVDAMDFIIKHGATIEEVTDRGQPVTRERIESKLIKQIGNEIKSLEAKFGLTPKDAEGIKTMEVKKKRTSIRDKY